jgi:hypothetical protein
MSDGDTLHLHGRVIAHWRNFIKIKKLKIKKTPSLQIFDRQLYCLPAGFIQNHHFVLYTVPKVVKCLFCRLKAAIVLRHEVRR